VPENGIATLSGTIVDPGTADTFTLVVNWGDGSPEQTFSYAAGTTDFHETHQYLDDDADDQYAVSLKLTDDDTGAAAASTTVGVTNVNPTIAPLTLNSVINEDGTVTVTGSYADVGTLDTHTVSIDWGDGTAATAAAVDAGAKTFTASHRYVDDNPTATASDTFTVKATVTDDDGGSASTSAVVTVNNVAPVLGNVAITNVTENGVATLSGTITDPGTADTFTLIVDWGDGSSETFSYAAGTKAFSQTHRYLDDNPTGTPSDTWAVKLKLTDDDTGEATASTNVTVTNAAPTINPLLLSSPSVDENGSVTVKGSYGDVGTLDTHTVSIDWGDGTTSAATVDAATKTFTASHQYLDDKQSTPPTGADDFTITATVTDDDTGSASASATLTVKNVAPTAVLSGDATGVRGQSRSFKVDFADTGTLDTHTVSIDWGDGTAAANPAVGETGGAGSASATHVYTAVGTYTVTATVTDDDGGKVTSQRTIVIKAVELQGGDLVVGGTLANDTISFNRLVTGILVSVNGANLGTFNVPSTGRLIAYGQAGDDILQGTSTTTLVTELYGDTGNDRLVGGAGPSQLVGGDGNDNLTAGAGRSVMVGAKGVDTLSGAAADDLLVGDDYVGSQDSLRSVLTRWAGAGVAVDRAAAIHADLDAAVQYDAAADVLTGNGGTDWFFSKAGSIADALKDRAAGELLN